MDKLKIIVLGDGLLGSEIEKQSGWEVFSRKRKNFSISDFPNQIPTDTDIIINCIANTDTYSKDGSSHWNTNVLFVDYLIDYCNKNNVKLVHISSDYVYTNSDENADETTVPLHCNNWYGYTKLISDSIIQVRSKNYLVIRCTHKPKPFPYEKAWDDQVGNFDYVDIISKKIIDLVLKNAFGVFNVGTETKTIYDLATHTKVVEPINSPEYVPKNTTMNVKKMENHLSKPFFSIAIPTYGYNGNGQKFLIENFEKLKSQTYNDFEVVISDHSIDDTIKDICDQYSSELNIKYFRNEFGRGVISPNINNAMRHCSGTWIKILFQDDFLYDQYSLEHQFKFIIKNFNMYWFATKFYHSNDGKTFYRLFLPKWNDLVWTGNNTIGCPSVITIKNENLEYFDEGLNWLMDVEFYKRVFDKKGEPQVLDEITVINRTWGDRLTDTITEELKTNEHIIVNKKYA